MITEEQYKGAVDKIQINLTMFHCIHQLKSYRLFLELLRKRIRSIYIHMVV